MLAPITLSQNKTRSNSYNTPSFKGIGDGVTAVLQACQKYPMVNVSVVDITSTTAPRTVVDLETAGPAAAAETFRRETSGLVVNCLIPSAFVFASAAAVNNIFMKEFPGVKMAGSWAGQDAIEALGDVYKKSLTEKNATESFVTNILHNLEGKNVEETVKYSSKADSEGFKKAVSTVKDLIENPDKKAGKALNDVYKAIAEETKATESLSLARVDKSGNKIVFNSSLSDLLRDMVDLGRKFKHVETNEIEKLAGKHGADITQAVLDKLTKFQAASSKMVNTKSLMGLAFILPLAMSMQYINRALTRKNYKQKGAPIYKDFGKGGETKEMTPAEKSKFFGEKLIAGATMIGVAALSMMQKPSLKMLQFTGKFPTVNQARWISAATFTSRLFASEDKNELRESLVRDIVTFSGLYFLGNYFSKGAASIIEKVTENAKDPSKRIKLINKFKLEERANDTSFFKKVARWVKDDQLKSFDELAKGAPRNMRAWCQIADIGLSILLLGVIVPLGNRKVTEKKVAKQKEQEALALKQNVNVNPINTKKSEVFGKFLG